MVQDGARRHRAQPGAVCNRANASERLVAPKLEGINVEWNSCQPTGLCQTQRERLAVTKHRHPGAYTCRSWRPESRAVLYRHSQLQSDGSGERGWLGPKCWRKPPRPQVTVSCTCPQPSGKTVCSLAGYICLSMELRCRYHLACYSYSIKSRQDCKTHTGVEQGWGDPDLPRSISCPSGAGQAAGPAAARSWQAGCDSQGYNLVSCQGQCLGATRGCPGVTLSV